MKGYWKCAYCGLQLSFKEVCQAEGHYCEIKDEE